jgi:site-specific recombinase
MGAAVAALGLEIFKMTEFWLAASGIVLIGFLNVTVAFSLALWTAIKSRNIKSIQRSVIYKALLTRFRKKPLSFFYPVKNKLVETKKVTIDE